MQLIPAKHILTKIKPSPFWFETDYNMNIYRGCNHGCIYCDSRSDCYHIQDFATVKAKENALQRLECDLMSKRKKGVIATGSMSDPYNPLEQKYCLTRGALELINKYRFGTAIATKSPLVARDVDLFKEISKHSNVIIKMTITTADDALCRQIEPAVAPASQRFNALSQLSTQGIFCGVLLMPLLPFINDTPQNILQLVDGAKASGAKFIYFAPGVTLRSNQRDYFYDKLDKEFPGIKEKYIKTFGETYACNSPRSKELFKLFSQQCEKAGILYKMPAIIAAYKKQKLPTQPELF